MNNQTRINLLVNALKWALPLAQETKGSLPPAEFERFDSQVAYCKLAIRHAKVKRKPRNFVLAITQHPK